MATTKKKRCFDAAFKLRVVENANKIQNRGAGRKFGVDENHMIIYLAHVPSRVGRKNTNYRYASATFQEL